MTEHTWLGRASDLLTEPDPGPTPFLVDGLLVDRCLGVLPGSWKVGKTWVLLELAIAIVTGRPALGRFTIPQPGPVIVVLEEASRDALHRRLDALTRGHATPPAALHELHYAANQRVRLDDPKWQNDIIDAAKEIQPRAVLFDPLARLKKASRDESSQKELGPVLEYLSDLRRETDAAALFAHHTGHQGEHMRGTSDMESWWESRLTVKKKNGAYALTAEHREAEDLPEISFVHAWDVETRSLRLSAAADTVLDQVAAHLREHPNDSGNKVFDAIGGTRAHVLAAVKKLRDQGGTDPPYHPRTTPSEAPSEGGTAEGLFRDLRTTPSEPGTAPSVPPLSEPSLNGSAGCVQTGCHAAREPGSFYCRDHGSTDFGTGAEIDPAEVERLAAIWKDNA